MLLCLIWCNEGNDGTDDDDDGGTSVFAGGPVIGARRDDRNHY